ncbi:MAG: hypothetical protein LBD07_05240, partial [Spirochaetaceae bacterium]|nr:hypothetical protein [Spirochaetaceae bacterium]
MSEYAQKIDGKYAQKDGGLKERIIALTLKEGFSRARICTSVKDYGTRHILPEQTTAMLVAALPYEFEAGVYNEHPPSGFAEIAEFARGNYYREAVLRLKKIANTMNWRKRDCRIFCNSRIAEKSIALSCGLGVRGRHSLIITPEAGSFVIIAMMTLPVVIEGDGPVDGVDLCAACSKSNPPCAVRCPTGAVKPEGGIDVERCIQWYASGNGSCVPHEISKRWGRRFYGCIECQRYCPHNKTRVCSVKLSGTPLERFINIDEFLTMSEEQIRMKFKGSTLGM